MKNKDSKNNKISLTGSLASLAKEVQNDVPVVEQEVIKKKTSIRSNKSNWDDVVNTALAFKSSPEKNSTVYIYEHIKKDVELLKQIEGLEYVPLTALISSIIENFLNDNTEIIRELLRKKETRF